jgi:hypothetical protein
VIWMFLKKTIALSKNLFKWGKVMKTLEKTWGNFLITLKKETVS